MRPSFGALGADANSDNAGLGAGGLLIRGRPIRQVGSGLSWPPQLVGVARIQERLPSTLACRYL